MSNKSVGSAHAARALKRHASSRIVNDSIRGRASKRLVEGTTLPLSIDDRNLGQVLAHSRWTIEQSHREAKQMLGLDQFEGRSYQGWCHHITMVLLAYAYPAQQRAHDGTPTTPRPTPPATAHAIVLEMATQDWCASTGSNEPKPEAWRGPCFGGSASGTVKPRE